MLPSTMLWPWPCWVGCCPEVSTLPKSCC
jgi:hypothetical protein